MKPITILLATIAWAGQVTAQDAPKPEPAEATPNPAEVRPAEPAAKPVPAEVKPAPEAVKKAEPELNPETQRLIEEAKQKIIREQAEKEANEKKAREEAARKAAEEKSFFGMIKSNSNLYAGASAGLGLSLNKVHGTGFGFGGLMDYVLFKHYGLHLGFETGQYPTQTINLTSGNSTIPITSGATLGFLAIDATAFYAFPRLLGVDSSLGIGLAYYRLTGGNYEFNSVIAPRISATFYYTVFSSLQVGLIWNLTIASASKITTGGVDYPLDSSVGITTMGVQVALRYGLF